MVSSTRRSCSTKCHTYLATLSSVPRLYDLVDSKQVVVLHGHFLQIFLVERAFERVPSHSSTLYVGTFPFCTRLTTNTTSVQPGKYPFLNGLNFSLSLTRSPTLNFSFFVLPFFFPLKGIPHLGTIGFSHLSRSSLDSTIDSRIDSTLAPNLARRDQSSSCSSW